MSGVRVSGVRVSDVWASDGRAPRSEAGVVAVVTALVVALVVLPLAALTVDLGHALLTGARLQSAADLAALAGVTSLAQDAAPDTDAARARAARAVRDSLCGQEPAGQAWAATCAGDATSLDWASDGDPDNGEIGFRTGTPDPARGLTRVAAAGNPLTGVRVVTPPVRVRFGFAPVLGVRDATEQRTATAALGTALPPGAMLPLVAIGSELGRRRLCLLGELPAPVPVTGSDPCASPAALRRVVQVARRPSGGRSADLAANLRSGVQAPLTAWGATAGPGVPCSGLIPLFDVVHTRLFPLAGSANCADLATSWSTVSGLRALVTNGTTARGRLRSSCSGATFSSHGLRLDATDLFGPSGASLLDRPGTGPLLAASLWSNAVPEPQAAGWVTERALRCGRFGVVPVVDTSLPLPTTALSVPIRRFVPVWIDGPTSSPLDTRGVLWGSSFGTDVRGVRAYNLDGYLPRLVTTPAQLGAYLPNSPGLPRAVALIHDAADPPT